MQVGTEFEVYDEIREAEGWSAYEADTNYIKFTEKKWKFPDAV